MIQDRDEGKTEGWDRNKFIKDFEEQYGPFQDDEPELSEDDLSEGDADNPSSE